MTNVGSYMTKSPHTIGVEQTLAAAREAFATSAVARGALGDDVVDHYVNMADVELAAFRAAVTDWELYRGFERL